MSEKSIKGLLLYKIPTKPLKPHLKLWHRVHTIDKMDTLTMPVFNSVSTKSRHHQDHLNPKSKITKKKKISLLKNLTPSLIFISGALGTCVLTAVVCSACWEVHFTYMQLVKQHWFGVPSRFRRFPELLLGWVAVHGTQSKQTVCTETEIISFSWKAGSKNMSVNMHTHSGREREKAERKRESVREIHMDHCM